jgi:hypothetical protein
MPHWKSILLLLGVLAGAGCSGFPGTSAAGQLSISATSLNFGNTGVGDTATQEVSIRNTGTQDVVVSQEQVTGAPFSTAGIGSNLVLTAGQGASLSVNFRPTAPGAAVGSVVLSSNTGSSPMVIALAGQGREHFVTLNWAPAASPVSGYYVYRSSSSDGPWTRLTASILDAFSYTDFTVQPGQLYYYAVSSIAANGEEGPLSQPASVAVPS